VARHGAKHGINVGSDRFDARASAFMAAEYAADNQRYLKRKLGRDVRPGEIYVAHFMGAGGARRLIQATEADPGVPAADMFQKAASANPSIFYNEDGSSKSVGEVYDNLMATVEGAPENPTNPQEQPTVPGELPSKPEDTDEAAAVPQDAVSEFKKRDPFKGGRKITFGEIEVAPPPPSASDTVKEAMRMAEREKEISLMQGFKDAFDQEGLLSYAFIGNTELAPDKNFVLDETMLKEVSKGVPEEYLEWFSEAHSEAHLMQIRDHALADVEKTQRLEALGWTGTGLRVLANVVDPAQLAIGVATLGLGNVALGGRALSTAGKIAYGAGSNAAVSGGIEGLALLSNPHRSGMDVLYGAAGGLVLGGLLGPLARNPATAGEATELRNIGKSLRDSIDNELNHAPIESQHIDDLARAKTVLFKGLSDVHVTEELGEAIQTAIRILPKKYRLEVEANLKLKGFGTVQGVHYPGLAMVALSTSSQDITKTIRNEAIHALRKSAIISDEQWGVLAQAVKDNDWMTQFNVRQRWEAGYIKNGLTGDALEDKLVEEAVAEAYGHFLKGTTKFSPPVEEVFTLMQRVGEAIRKAMGKKSMDPNDVVKDIFTQIENGNLDGQGLSVLLNTKPRQRVKAGSRSVGAKENELVEEKIISDPNFDKIQDTEVESTAFGKIRYDVVGQLKSSKNALSRLFGGVLGEDAVGNAGNTVNRFGASEEMDRYFRTWMTSYRRMYTVAWSDWKKSQNLNVWSARNERGNFHDEVTRYIRNTDPSINDTFHPAVVKLGNRVSQLQEEIRKLAQNPLLQEGKIGKAVAGFDEVLENPNYVTRMWSHQKLNDAIAEFGEGSVTDLVYKAMRSAQPEADDELLKRVAKAFTRAIHKRAKGADAASIRAFTGDDPTLLREFLMDAGLDEIDADRLVKSLKKSTDPKAHPRGESRVLMDETFVVDDVLDRNGVSTGRSLSLTDLLNNDIDDLFTHYSRSLAGAISLAKVRIKDPKTGELIVNGISSDADFETLLRRMREWGAENIRDGNASDVSKADETNLRWLYDRIKGVPDPAQQGKVAASMRMLRKYNFIRVMNQVGFAQIQEAAVTVGTLGVRAALSHMPAFRRIANMDGEKILRDGLGAEIEAIFGIGTDRLRNVVSNRYDDFAGTGLAHGSDSFGSKLENVLDAGSRITSDISGMSTVNAALQRWTAKAVAQKFANLALDPSKANMKRMASIGLDDKMLKRISKEVNENFSKEEGMLFSGKVTRMNLDNWKDLEARAAFENALHRWSRRIIQENDIGAMHRWMSHPVSQLILQFRTFMLGSWTKQFLHGVHMRDWETFSAFTMSMVGAGTVYTMQENLKAVGRSDKDERLQFRLSPQNIAKAAFARSGWAAMFPAAVDTGIKLTSPLHDFDPMFDFRTTGQASDLIFGNPSSGLYNSLQDANVTSQKGMRSFQQMLPFQNFIPISSLYSYMISDLPERDRR